MAMRAPREASSLAVARPSPRAPPVMATTRPAMGINVFDMASTLRTDIGSRHGRLRDQTPRRRAGRAGRLPRRDADDDLRARRREGGVHLAPDAPADGWQGLLRASSQGGGGDLLRRGRHAAVQARGRGARPGPRIGCQGAAARAALGLERHRPGRGRDHRLEPRERSAERRRNRPRLLAGRVELGAMAPAAALGDSFRSFFDSVDSFFSNLAAVHLGSLLLSLAAFTAYLTLRSRASFNILRAAYPDQQFRWLHIWGAYFAGYGFNSVIPARGGDVIRLFLTKTSVPGSSYPAVAATFAVEGIFDVVMGSLMLAFAFTQGAFPKPPDFSKLNAFDLTFFAKHPHFGLFFLTALGVGVLVAFGILSIRIQAFWRRVRQGLVVLSDRRRYLREVFGVQLAGWAFRFTAFWFMLSAFNVGASVRNVLLVLGVNAVGAAVPFTPQGAGVTQALLVKVFHGAAAGATVAAYSVGQQIAIAALTFTIGFLALVFIFRVRSFKEVIERGRADRQAAQAAPAA